MFVQGRNSLGSREMFDDNKDGMGDFEHIEMDISPDHTIENPFKDNLANSEAQPIIQKLDVFINDNYMDGNQLLM
jgi:hypothetical protein